MSGPIVVKLGSNLVVGPDRRPRQEIIKAVTAEVSDLVQEGTPVVVVSSGAIALGAARARLRNGRKGLAPMQAASALGQPDLHRLWQNAFAAHSLPVAQVLLTGIEIAERRSYVNIRNTLQVLFAIPAVPILNENDATSTDEISFGDNDVLAAQIAVLLRAASLILLTAAEGVMSHPPGASGATVIREGNELGDAVLGQPSRFGRGGIESKISAAVLAAAGGVETVIASPCALGPLLRGERAGTHFAAAATTESSFKLWLRYGKPAASAVHIDSGAAKAIQENGSSLLAVGVLAWTTDFRAGDALEICHPPRNIIARGVSSVDSADIGGRPVNIEVVHRDRLVLM
ncbi:MAG TPA: glutamate 5-kinase [Gaiellaceae bacterium]